MSFLQIVKVLISFILFKTSIVISKESSKICDVEAYCDNCTFYEIKTQNNITQFSFKNLFCIQKQTNILSFNEAILPHYNTFFQNNIYIPKINSDQKINLNTLKKSFNIIKFTNKDSKYLNKTHFNCLISNSKYYNNKIDSAFLSISSNLQSSIKENISKKNIFFYIIFENTKKNSSLILNGHEEKILNFKWKKEINEYDKLIILLEFYNNIFENDDDYFEIKIETKNISITRKKIIISVIGILLFIMILFIVPYNTYTYLKEKKLQKNINKELENERNKKEEVFQKMFKNILIQTELSTKNNIKNYPQCPICLQTFILKCLICITPCKHIFHYECLKKFAQTKIQDLSALRCPLCNFVFWNECLRDNGNIVSTNRNSNVNSTEQFKIVISNECLDNI